MTLFQLKQRRGKLEGHLILANYYQVNKILTSFNFYFFQAVQHGNGVVEVKMKKPNFTATPGQVVTSLSYVPLSFESKPEETSAK